MDQLIYELNKQFIKDIPPFRPGDTIKIYFKLTETREDPKSKKLEEKVRIQPFEGIVINKRGSGTSLTCTVRKVTQGIGVERIFPLASHLIEKIEVKKRGKVRRAKLYYLRGKKEKAARIKEII